MSPTVFGFISLILLVKSAYIAFGKGRQDLEGDLANHLLALVPA